jgi:NAD(P)-dependent dehydrogenase (short-subunit alcohol dehydrogenase family)
VADVTAALTAALTAEGFQVRLISPGTSTRRLHGDSYEADLSSSESLRQLHQLVRGTGADPIAGVINLLGLQPRFRVAGLEDVEAPLLAAAWTFQVVKEFAGDLQAGAADGGGWFVNVTALDGHFGLGERSMTTVVAAGTLGIGKTLRREYPRLRVKNIDVEPTMPADMLIARLLGELENEDDLIEVGLTRSGRWRPALQEDALRDDLPPVMLDQESVVLVTGGACGITGAIARRLAAEARPRLVLVGRSPAPATEPPQTRALDRAGLRQRYFDEARVRGKQVVPVEINRAVARILKDREIRANLDVCTAAGATVEYHPLDVRDAEAFGRLIDGLYERFGRIDGVIHGAGTIDDRRIRDKTLESFTGVFRTKVDSACTLARKLRPENLKFLAFFGSVVGRFGNAGQVDYGAANEALNKLADYLQHHWPGRVVCLNWGPWEGGMVSEELRRLYTAAGVELIPTEEGVAAFLAELKGSDRGSAEVVLACGVRRFADAAHELRKNRKAHSV